MGGTFGEQKRRVGRNWFNLYGVKTLGEVAWTDREDDSLLSIHFELINIFRHNKSS